jgi:hypothetical protein
MVRLVKNIVCRLFDFWFLCDTMDAEETQYADIGKGGRMQRVSKVGSRERDRVSGATAQIGAYHEKTKIHNNAYAYRGDTNGNTLGRGFRVL